MKLLVIAAKAVQMMPLRHETSCYSRKIRPNDASEARNFSYSLAKSVKMMPLKRETSRYSRKSRPNDASEARNCLLATKPCQMMPLRHETVRGYVKGLSRGQPWVCDPQEGRNSS